MKSFRLDIVFIIFNKAIIYNNYIVDNNKKKYRET